MTWLLLGGTVQNTLLPRMGPKRTQQHRGIEKAEVRIFSRQNSWNVQTRQVEESYGDTQLQKPAQRPTRRVEEAKGRETVCSTIT